MSSAISIFGGLSRRASERGEREADGTRWELREGAVIGVDGPASLVCARGVVWVTQDGDERDHVLRAGEGWVPDGAGGRVVVQALTGAVVTGRF